MTEIAQGFAYRINRATKELWWVAQTPGDGGKDWGYSLSRADARLLPSYWLKRFEADMRRVKDTAYVVR